MSLFSENKKILDAFERDGDILSIPRIVDFEHIFKEKSSAERFAVEAKIHGFDVKIRLIDNEIFKWDAQASKYIIPNCDNITDTEIFLGEIARRLGGRPDGWGFVEITSEHQPSWESIIKRSEDN